MRRIRTLAVLVAVLSLVVAASSARADKNGNGKKHKGHHVHGVVTSVEVAKDAAANSGTLKVKVSQHHHKKGGGNVTAAAPAPAEQPPVEKTFTVNADTKFFKVSGKKGAKEKTPITFADVKDGEHVVVVFDGAVAKEVLIHHHHDHKKDKKPAA